MNFTQIVTEVTAITKRPDKIPDARREVNNAILFFSTDADFSRDLAEVYVPILPQEYSQEVLFTSLPRFRKMHYIKRAGTQQYLLPLDKNEMFKSCADTRDKYYTIGQGIRISMTALAQGLDFGFWQFPPYLSDASPEHWQLEGNWAAVMDRAAAKVFANIGDDASSAKHERYAVASYLAFRATMMNQP